MSEANYDFRKRHWEYHRKNLRNAGRICMADETMLDGSWAIGCASDAGEITQIAVKDFRDYLETSMDLSLRIVHENAANVLWVGVDEKLPCDFAFDVNADGIKLTASCDRMTFRGTIHLEDIMNLEGIPALKRGRTEREFMYTMRIVHSGSGIDYYPDSELIAMLHAGYDTIDLFLEGIDRNHIGYCDFNDIIERAYKFGIRTVFHNYIRTFIHPDEDGAQAVFDAVYGEIVRRYPKVAAIDLCGEALEFPSRDKNTTGKHWKESIIDGIPDTRPSPGWYPCCDYPAYIQCIERAVHKFNPAVDVNFSTYNWGYQPLEMRKKFLDNFPENVGLSVCFEIFSKRKLENLYTPVMDYTISAGEPGYYFSTECDIANRNGIKITGNVNTAGIAWDFGCVPLVPAPGKLLERNLNLRIASKKYNVRQHYTTHHYGWWNNVAADLGKWTGWEGFEPDYDELLRKIAVRDYGRNAAEYVLEAWKCFSEGMNHYIASNEDQYGPWRVGAAYPFVFHPNISRTMAAKEIKFPTAPHAHFGSGIVKTFYNPYENTEQSPGFLRYPAELRSLNKMLERWDAALDAAAKAVETADENKRDEARRLEALGKFIRASIVTTMHIKEWWQLNMAMQNCKTAEDAGSYLDKIEALAYEEMKNVRELIPYVEFDSRLGWEPSMEYVCDKWHLEWKIRQVESTLREIADYRKMLFLHLTEE